MTDGEKRKKGRKPVILILAAAVIVSVAWIVWLQMRPYEKTDDAQVDGNVHPVCARVAGYVQEVRVDDNQTVQQGDVLVVLDPTDYDARVRRAAADLQAAQAAAAAAGKEALVIERTTPASVTQAEALLASSGAQLEMSAAQKKTAETRERRAKDDLDRTRPLVEKDLASAYRLDVLEDAWEAAKSTVQSAQANVSSMEARRTEAEAALVAARSRLTQIERARAMAESAAAQVQVAEAKLENARLDRLYTVIGAPAAGTVAQKFSEVGQFVQPGQTLMFVVPLADTWVTANFKETQLTHMNPGQPAEVTVDAYPGVTLKGVVNSIAAGTGARFSLLPPENATGNYVKIVQRVPVKIVLERRPGDPILRPGMNCEVRVRIEK